jgi:hypothetical protein
VIAFLLFFASLVLIVCLLFWREERDETRLNFRCLRLKQAKVVYRGHFSLNWLFLLSSRSSCNLLGVFLLLYKNKWPDYDERKSTFRCNLTSEKREAYQTVKPKYLYNYFHSQ